MARTKCQFRFVCTQMCDCCVYAPASSQFVAPALAASRPSSVLQLFCWRFQPESRTRFDYKPTQLKSNSTQSSRADAVAALVARGLHLAQRSIPSILQYYGLRYCSPIFVLSWFRKSNSPRGKHRRAGERAKMRQRCGSVYTWNCAGELYAIECSLCEQRPLCALSEFPEHMDVWHSDWQAPDAQVDEATCSSEAVPEDELMQEVLAEQRTNGEDNELKQQLVLELNATEEEMLPDESVVSVQPVDALAEAETFEPPGELDKFLDTSEEPATNAEIESPRGPDTTMQEASPVPEGQRLSSQHIQRLIELYRSEPRLWNQSHAEFHDMELCRASWRRITDAWGAYCGRSFSVTDVRIRVSTLCQRFLKQRERLEADGELDDAAKFAHFDQLGFLCEQQSLLKRQRHYARENRRLLELYEHYPVLWHNAHKRVRCAESVRQRQDAHLGLQMALRLSGITLSPVVIQRRLQSLRKRYRLEKISYLQSVVEGRQAEFVSGFEHYAEMEFLHKHIDPYVCAVCGKIFEKLEGHQAHVQSSCEARRAGEPEDAQAEADQSLQKHLKVVLSEENELVRKLTQQTVDLLKEKLAEAPMVAQSVEDSLGSGAGGQETPGLPSLAEACAAAQLDDPGELDTFLDPVEAESAEGRVSLRLSPSETQELVRLYRSHVCLWDPNHLDYHARNQRRLAWQAITEELTTRADSRGGQSRFTWQMLHRKITDYTKYYRKERQRQIRQTDPHSSWSLFEEFRFLDDVLPISSEVQKTLSQRETSLKIIAVYQSSTQLWCTDHPDYTKRRQRQRQLVSLCTRLQEECNLQMTVERLKSRLIEFRCQYRHCKEARLEALKESRPWTPNYEYYEPLRFLELHVAPFQCPRCPASFKRRTDYLQHERNVHAEAEKSLDGEFFYVRRRGKRGKSREDQNMANICHICGLKFSLRNSLLAHLRRHLGQRTFACAECPKKFFSSTALRVHQRSHTKELPYVCEHCARGFVNASKLNQHVKRHRNQRDFPCNRCEKAFYTAHERDRHLRAHLNIRDKVCPYCSRAFVVGSAYYAHLNLHRSEKRYACAACGTRFAQYAGLYKHRRRCLPAEVIEE